MTLSTTSLAVQWLGLCPSTAGGTGSIPGWGTKIPHAARCSQKTKPKPNKMTLSPPLESSPALHPGSRCFQQSPHCPLDNAKLHFPVNNSSPPGSCPFRSPSKVGRGPGFAPSQALGSLTMCSNSLACLSSRGKPSMRKPRLSGQDSMWSLIISRMTPWGGKGRLHSVPRGPSPARSPWQVLVYSGEHPLLGSLEALFFFFLILFIYLFIFGCAGSSLRCVGFSLRWLLLLQSTGPRCTGFSSCGSWALEHRLSSCGTRA